MADNYKEKIQKLLRLADSPNEHEAKSALLKARKLMAEHKLTEAECLDVENKEVRKILTDIQCSKENNPWIIELSAKIADNYCCRSYRSKGYRKKTYTLGFYGLDGDIDICKAVFEYAVECVFSGIEDIKRRLKEHEISTVSIRNACNSYGYGFVKGIQSAFDKQKEENQEWGLVMMTPEAVLEAISKLMSESFKSKAEDNIISSAYKLGNNDGEDFKPEKRIKGKGESEEILLTYIGMDSWDRPVYRDKEGILWKDVDPRQEYKPNLCNAVNNEFDGEPDTGMKYMEKYKNAKLKFVPERVVWR